MDFFLCLLTLLGSYIELPTYLKFASRSSRAVSTQPHPSSHHQPSLGRWEGLMPVRGEPPGPLLVGEFEQVPEPFQIIPSLL